MWAQHEGSHLSSASKPSECSFCSAIYQHGGPAYYRHVSAHLREVSLSVLPQPADDDDGFDTDDSDPPSSASGSERIHPDTNVDKEAEPKEDPPIVETAAEEYQSQPSLVPIPSVTSLDPHPTLEEQYGLNSPLETEAAGAETGPTTDASATSEKDGPSTEKKGKHFRVCFCICFRFTSSRWKRKEPIRGISRLDHRPSLRSQRLQAWEASSTSRGRDTIPLQ